MKDTTKNKSTLQRKKQILPWLLSLLLLVSITFAACEGPAGPRGPQGPQGPQGPVGPAGENGSQILAGKSAPADTLGDIGDLYLNLKNADLYGPKNEKGWGTPINLRGDEGPRGPAGEDGSQIYSGTKTPPPASLGKPGDYYLNTKTFDLYGPKTKSGWGTPINLKGTANVMYSSWITVKSSDWKTDGTSRVHTINANALSKSIVNKGIVNVYLDLREQMPSKVKYVWSLPRIFGNIKFRYVFKPQTIRLEYFNRTDPSKTPTKPGFNMKFRYVLIPGGVAADSRFSREEVKDMTYKEVHKHFSGKSRSVFN